MSPVSPVFNTVVTMSIGLNTQSRMGTSDSIKMMSQPSQRLGLASGQEKPRLLLLLICKFSNARSIIQMAICALHWKSFMTKIKLLGRYLQI